MCTIVIPPADLDRLCDPDKLTEYWEPNNDPKKFHTTLALAFVRDIFHDCPDKSRRSELAVSVAVVRKPAHKSTMTFEQAAVELLNPAERAPTLLLVRLHRESGLFPDCYYHHSRKHFAVLYDTGEDYNCGSPLHFIGAELLSSYEPGKDHSPRAKIPPSWRRDPGISPPELLHTRLLRLDHWISRNPFSGGTFCLAVRDVHPVHSLAGAGNHPS